MKSSLRLETDFSYGKTNIKDIYFEAPYKIMSPFVQEDCTEVMQMCASAGMLSGDMFDLEFMSYPIFNLADIFVVIGVLLGAVYYLWFYDKYDKPKKEPDHDAGADSRN